MWRPASSWLIASALAFFPLSMATASMGQSNSTSMSLQGTVETGPGQRLKLRVSDLENPINLVTESDLIKEDLSHLKHGDYLNAFGHIDDRRRTFEVISIQSLGFQSLLGPWMTTAHEIYRFKDFNTLSVYSAPWIEVSQAHAPLPSQRDRTKLEFHYVLAPEKGRVYSLFLSDQSERPTVQVGSLEIRPHHLRLIMFGRSRHEPSRTVFLMRGVAL